MSKINVIGSGFGGLAVAIRLQSKGFQVTLFEKNAKPGGHAYQLNKSGYVFDMGPSLITAPDIIRSVFSSAGERMEDYLDLIYLNPFYRIYYHDGSVLDYTADSGQMKQQMAKFNRDDAKNYDKFIDYVKKLHKAVIDDGLGSEPFNLGKLWQFLPQALKLKALQPCYNVVSKFFKDPRNRFIFSFHPLFIGGSPFRAPSVYLMIPYLEKDGGVWFTEGGMYSLVKAFQTVFEKQGGEVRTDSAVEEIVVRDGMATGVMVNGNFFPSDAVISNAHFYHTYSELVGKKHRKKWSDSRVARQKYSMSSFLIYLGVKKQYPQLEHHTLILSERYKELVKDIFDRKILPDDFSMYLHVPTRSDPGMAPADCESMYVLVPVPNLASKTDWRRMAIPYAEKILSFLEKDFGLIDLKANIEVMELFTPDDFESQRNNYLGSAWGVEPRLTQTASFRPANRSEDVDRLYLVGASTHPGAGVPGVLLTAEATAKAVLQDFQPELLPFTNETQNI